MTIELYSGLGQQSERIDIPYVASLTDFEKLPENIRAEINLGDIEMMSSIELKNIMIPLIFQENVTKVWVASGGLDRINGGLAYFRDVTSMAQEITDDQYDSYTKLFIISAAINNSIQNDLEIIINLQTFLAQITGGLIYAYKAMHDHNEMDRYMELAKKHFKAAINLSKGSITNAPLASNKDDATISKNIVAYLKGLTQEYKSDAVKVKHLQKLINDIASTKEQFFIRFFRQMLNRLTKLKKHY